MASRQKLRYHRNRRGREAATIRQRRRLAMTLRLMRGRSDRRSFCRFAAAAAALLVVLALGVTSLPPGRAQDAAAAAAFTATVTVDATADTVVTARETARLDGQRRALAAVVERLAGNSSSAPAKLPKLDDQRITDLVASFAVANERMSAVRYLADYTFHFRPRAVRRLLGEAGIKLAARSDATPPPPPSPPSHQPMGSPAPAAAGKSPALASEAALVVIPVYQSDRQPTLWEDPNPWRDAWDQQPAAAAGRRRLIVPLGDAADIAAIDAGKARAGDAAALAAIARRNGGGDEAVVAFAALRGPPDRPAGVDITVRDYRAGQLVGTHNAPLTANPDESGGDLLHRAVAVIAADLEGGGWQTQTQPPAAQDRQGSLTAVLPIADLDDWVHARTRLAAVPAIRKLALVALSRQEATIEIDYVGTIDQLKTDLAEIDLDLVRGEPLWRLARGGWDGRAP
jgi:Uncharacterized protein conserved in bacteria (DUF2066)